MKMAPPLCADCLKKKRGSLGAEWEKNGRVVGEDGGGVGAGAKMGKLDAK